MDFVSQSYLDRVTLRYDREGLSNELLRTLYERLLLPRMIEEKMLSLLRQGKVSKWFSGIGQEAIAVGAASVLEPDEWILPMHRNLGVFTTREVPLATLFKQLQGKAGGFSRGRERSFHFGIQEHRIWGMISHLGPQLSIADGLALGHKLKGEKKATIVFTGEGGTSEGEFHEALNVAAVWKLPVLFVIENNGYGLSTPVQEQFVCEKLADRGIGYGMEAVTIDGNNILEVYRTLDHYARSIREEPRPVLIECITFRMRGHEEASGTKYVPPALMEAWAAKDPVVNYEDWLAETGVVDEAFISSRRDRFKQDISAALKDAFDDPDPVANTETEFADVYKPYTQVEVKQESVARTEKRFVDAISDGLREAMQRHPKLVLMGQDIAGYGGVFKITEGFLAQFGPDRVRNTPLCESAIIGTALGMSALGFKSMVEMQFADFVTCGFNQIINNLAKIHYRWGVHADVVVRMPTGAGVGAGPFHSQSNEAWFTHTPGLKVVYPSTPEDAKGLLIAAIEDPNPVLYFEHKMLYRSISGPVPDGYYTIPIGKARQVAEGTDIAIITYGAGVHWGTELAVQMPEVSFDILDLRSLLPIDWQAVANSVARTGKVLVLHEDTLTGGIGGEVAAWIAEHCFHLLDAPVKRLGSLDTPVPFARTLEENFLPKGRMKAAVEELLGY